MSPSPPTCPDMTRPAGPPCCRPNCGPGWGCWRGGAIEQQLRSRVKESLGVSHDEFLVLCLLADGPATGLRMTQIAERLGRPKTRLTYQVACLQHAGLITRSTACGDRRGIQVTLTDKARQLLRDASGALAEAVTRAIKSLEGQHDCAMMHSLLPKSTDAEDNT